MTRLCLLLLWLPLAAPAAPAAVVLHDRAQLAAALKVSPACCVVDARSAKTRSAVPIPGALIYTDKLRINPTSAVVVIADSDRAAVRAGEALAARSGAKQVLAVRGGLATWEAATRPDSPGAVQFVIPSDTCQQGTPLETRILEKK